MIRGGREDEGVDALRKAWDKDKFNVRVFNTLNLYERDIVVVRPDQHVAWRGNADPPDATDVVAQMTGNK